MEKSILNDKRKKMKKKKNKIETSKIEDKVTEIRVLTAVA